MTLWTLLLVLGIGIISGILNVTAGGGSLITMPILIFLGLPSAVANGTNRIALMVQNIIAVSNFKKNGYFDKKLGIMLAVPAFLGSSLGSHLAIALTDHMFNTILAVVMVFVVVLMVFEPHKRLMSAERDLSLRHKIMGCIVFFFIGLYGGFIQAGVGFLIIAALTLLTGFSLVRINSMKVFIVAMYMSVSLVVFIMSGKVDWLLGVSLAVGNGLGAYIASAASIKKGDVWIKKIMVVAILLMAFKLLGGFKWLVDLL